MNLLKILFGDLTKTGVEQGDGSQTFYNDPSQAGGALARTSHRRYSKRPSLLA